MADEVGDQVLESETNEPEENYCKIISYPGSKIPNKFRNLYLATFKNTLREHNDQFKLIDKDAYYKYYGAYIENLLNRPRVRFRIAILNDMDTVIGWSLYEDEILHYVFVKKENRKDGIGRSLLPSKISRITHITTKAFAIWANFYPWVIYDPFI